MNKVMIILCGATGDLARRKIIPALYGMFKEGVADIAIIGIALEGVDAPHVVEAARPFVDGYDEHLWKKFAARMSYVPLDVTTTDGFDLVAQLVEQKEKEFNLPGNRLVYCATAPEFFVPITTHMAKQGIIKKGFNGENGAAWHRVVYEKPFGLDRASAQKINDAIARNLDESQIVRIDHYLAKELVANIALARFTNRVLEPLWCNKHIENVQIVLSETVGLENRGHYYDHHGALRDVVQNHMLQLLALVAMEAPKQLSGDFIRDKKADVLKVVKPIDGLLGQCKGYRNEQGVASDSATETFAALQLMVDNDRWRGVPFYLRTGKCLDKKEVVIYIRFKQVECLMATSCPSEPNFLIIRVSPNEGFSLELNAKRPGVFDEITPVTMDYCHHCLYSPRTPHSYELLLAQVFAGEQSVSVRFDEIDYAWRVIDQLYQMQLPLYEYQKGSSGPRELDAFGAKYNMRWRT